VGRVGRPGLQGAGDGGLDLPIGDRGRGTGPRFVSQSLQAALGEPIPPLADGGEGDVQISGDGGVGLSVGGSQDDPGTQGQALGGLGPACPLAELGTLGIRQGDGRGRGSAGHRELLQWVPDTHTPTGRNRKRTSNSGH